MGKKTEKTWIEKGILTYISDVTMGDIRMWESQENGIQRRNRLYEYNYIGKIVLHNGLQKYMIGIKVRSIQLHWLTPGHWIWVHQQMTRV